MWNVSNPLFGWSAIEKKFWRGFRFVELKKFVVEKIVGERVNQERSKKYPIYDEQIKKWLCMK